jgi:hypothetical protein
MAQWASLRKNNKKIQVVDALAGEYDVRKHRYRKPSHGRGWAINHQSSMVHLYCYYIDRSCIESLIDLAHTFHSICSAVRVPGTVGSLIATMYGCECKGRAFVSLSAGLERVHAMATARGAADGCARLQHRRQVGHRIGGCCRYRSSPPVSSCAWAGRVRMTSGPTGPSDAADSGR